MKHKIIISTTLLLIIFVSVSAIVAAKRDKIPVKARQSLSERVSENIRTSTEGSRKALDMAGIDKVTKSTADFYNRRSFKPVWSDDKGLFMESTEFAAVVRNAESGGLNPEDYRSSKIDSLLATTKKKREAGLRVYSPRIAALELLLSEALFAYGSHVAGGRLDPKAYAPEWRIVGEKDKVALKLEKSLAAGSVITTLKGLAPEYSEYKNLRKSLQKYQAIAAAGGWATVPGGEKLEKGSQNKRVAALRKRLAAEGYMCDGESVDAELFDEKLEKAVIEYQKRNGLDADGVVGRGTFTALNVSVENRINQIELNMERWRWMPADMGHGYFMVNIPQFRMEVIEDGAAVLEMKVIIGKQTRRTPIIQDEITYLVLAPYWNVTYKMAVNDKLPEIIKDSTYLKRNHIRVFQGSGADAVEIAPSDVDWSKLNAKNFKYRLRQDPGSFNALGRVKFMFPNKDNVYMHDTPTRKYFSRTVRAFSSGCIRLEKPIELAEYLLRFDPKWTRDAILAVIKAGKEKNVSLKESMPVYLVYFTVVASPDGKAQFFNDLYGHDKRLTEAFARARVGLTPHR